MSQAAEKAVHAIVVGVDGSEPSLAALRWAGRQARLTGAPLKVITAWEIPQGAGWAATYPVDYDPQALAGEILNKAVLDTFGPTPEVPIERIVIEGHAAHVLGESAKDADLLVVGSRGHGAIAGMLIGSVSEHLVRHAPCAVVVVHDGERSE